MDCYVRATLDIHETGQHRAYIRSVAKSTRSCGNRNVPRQNRTTYKINPGVQRKEERRTKIEQVRSMSSPLRTQPQKVCSNQSIFRLTELGNYLMPQDRRMHL